MPGECCPEKPVSKRLTVGGIQVGISEYDTIIQKALELENAPEDEIKRILLKELKIFNYVPASAEQDYLDAMWQEYKNTRNEREARKQEDVKR